MKLKYYVRGLGIGIVFATLLCVISFKVSGKTDMSDTEVIKRAEALGMIMKTDILKEETSEEETSEKETTTETKDNKEETESESEADTKETVNESKAETIAETLPAQTEPVTEAIIQTEAVTEPVTEPVKTVIENISVDVISGMDSGSVSKLLYAAGVVNDAAEFDRYLVNNNYANNIRTGNYVIPKGSSYDEIAKILTGR
ncbi:hypothetical protein KQI85_04555 [Falcatimonas sp. MSJ-15]|uniref:hypothetical protein n=1 Tax=Falcatimonas sp. MSJ-15 TaxID=2841515 RepID=UPI001C126FBA|nr:hypothetical protein [Falcatimonas sp. MSJ-15]MBU5469637.1 hypothetical protein [Falcatimonas sp. MSJ-15]